MSEELEIEPPAEPPTEAVAEVVAPAKSNQTTTWVLAGVASVAVLLAGVFGVKAFSKDDNNGATALNAASNSATANGNGTVRAFGNAGKITKIDGKNLTLQSTNFNNETTTVKVATDGDTKFQDVVEGSISDLKVGDTVLANGTTTDGVFTAERISQADVMRRVTSNNGAIGPNGAYGGPRVFSNGDGPPPDVVNGGQGPRSFQADEGSFAAGEITKIDGDTITVKEPQSGTEKLIKVASTTKVMVNKTIKLRDLKVGDDVRVGGDTDKDGVLQADTVTRGAIGGGLFRGGPGFQQNGGPVPIQGNTATASAT